ncbi:MAG: ribonuclease HI [Desulfobacterota bacterium]|nr:ribonuclease HI [Thermodesulfobacteriota bacterium]
MASRKKYYAVVRGRKTGIFTVWEGPEGAAAQVRGFSGACYKGFATREEAEAWFAAQKGNSPDHLKKTERRIKKAASLRSAAAASHATRDAVEIYTDGGCLNNPGPGGYGVVIIEGNKRRELSGGYRLTTNNRMELKACIEGLRAVPETATVRIYSDSQYLVNAMNRGWARKWRARNWKRSGSAPVENSDLWEQLLSLCETRTVSFIWIKGHAGTQENERCDRLAAAAMSRRNLPPDSAYEAGTTRAVP